MGKSFLELKKLAKGDPGSSPTLKIAVIGDCSTQHLSTAIKGELAGRRVSAEVYDTDYDQIDALTIDSASPLYGFQPDFVVVHCCTEAAYADFVRTPMAERGHFHEVAISRLSEVWKRIKDNTGAAILQFDFPERDDRILGDYGLKVRESFISQMRRLNVDLMDAAGDDARVGIVGVAGLKSRLGEKAFSDPKLYYSSKMPLSLEAVCAAAERVADVVLARKGALKKCVIVDLDNTLWGGVIGDDGLSGIRVGELGDGPAFAAFQTWLKELKGRGVILAVCSKNQEETAREPFERHPEMVLRLDDFAMFVANWEDKASNIKRIQETLNIGMDSIVFVDDNKFERELVKSLLPDVSVPELPSDPALYVEFLRGENLFETASLSAADLERTGQYIAEGRRRQAEALFSSFDDYLESLEMRATCSPFDEYHIPRIAQLTQRSNQFNLRTVRYSEEEVASIASSDGHLALYFTLSDKFGDHGLISLMIARKDAEGRSLFVDTWVMSCRVLRRGMEEYAMNTLVREAGRAGFETVVGEYVPTKKNGMVKDVYESMGFRRQGELFVLDVKDYREFKTHIKEA